MTLSLRICLKKSNCVRISAGYFSARSTVILTSYRIIDVCQGDLDDSGNLDGFDAADIAAEFVPSECGENCPPSDLNGDGKVNSDDIMLLANDFGRTGCPIFSHA
jgi:hypothetical protein